MALLERLQLPDRRTLIAAGLAALSALLVLALTRPTPDVGVLVAAAPIAAGEPLDAASVAVRRVPSGEGLVAGTSLGELEGWSLVAPLEAGEPILASHLVDPAATVRPSALGISLAETHAAMGTISAGDLIDIYVTWPGSGASPKLTELLAGGVTVLHSELTDDVGGRHSVSLLLAVDSELAPVIARGYRVGELDLVRVPP